MINNQQPLFDVRVTGCTKNKEGQVCIPVADLLIIFEKFPYLNGKDYKQLFETAKISDKIAGGDNEKQS